MKQFKLTFLLTVLMSMVGAKAYAYDIAVENADGVTIYYNYTNDGKELEVTTTYDGRKYTDNVVIPDEVTFMNRTRKVTSIGKNAFSYCNDLISVTIPNSVTSIGNSAFYYCSKMTSITIPNSVTELGEKAFYNCYGLMSINIPNSVTSIEESVFENCFGLTSITIPNSVTSIGESAFQECTGLTSITIPNSVTSIGRGAFNDCTGLTSVTIPNSVTSIEKYAFSGCDYSVVISLIENPFTIEGKNGDETFNKNTFNNATLYVPKGTIDKYKATKGWKDFLFIEEGTGGGETPPTPQTCEKPTISYKNGKLTFNSATVGATCLSSITDTDIASYSSNEVQLSATYKISVYATKTGYNNSETATATLCWIDVEPKTEGITNGIAQVPAKAVLIQTNGSSINVQGCDDGEQVGVYSINGSKVGSAISQNGVATVNTTLQLGSVAIVKIGDRNVKLIVK